MARAYAVALTVLGTAGILSCVALDALAAESMFAVRTLEQDIRELEMEHADLSAEVARLAYPRRIQSIATDQLGMVAAESVTFLSPAVSSAAEANTAVLAAR